MIVTGMPHALKAASKFACISIIQVVLNKLTALYLDLRRRSWVIYPLIDKRFHEDVYVYGDIKSLSIKASIVYIVSRNTTNSTNKQVL